MKLYSSLLKGLLLQAFWRESFWFLQVFLFIQVLVYKFSLNDEWITKTMKILFYEVQDDFETKKVYNNMNL